MANDRRACRLLWNWSFGLGHWSCWSLGLVIGFAHARGFAPFSHPWRRGFPPAKAPKHDGLKARRDGLTTALVFAGTDCAPCPDGPASAPGERRRNFYFPRTSKLRTRPSPVSSRAAFMQTCSHSVMKGLPFIVALLSLTLGGCASCFPPEVRNVEGINRLGRDQEAVRARLLRDDAVPALARLRSLREIDLYGGFKRNALGITDAGLGRLANLQLPQLDHLSLGHSRRITDRGLADVARMSTLRSLGLLNCDRITSKGLAHLAGMVSLRRLDLRGCDGITDEALERLHGMYHLEELELAGCQVTEQGVRKLQNALPGCRVSKDEQMWAYQGRE